MAQSENAKGIESKFCSKFNNIFVGYCWWKMTEPEK
jgi:hypothetical protein